jgi:GntR family transcriptional regulator / MocR family aminotransferase
MTPKNETSQPIDLLLAVHRDDPRTLGAQIEDQLRGSIRSGTLRPQSELPSTRDLARQLGISRRVVVDAYGQLAAEGYLSLRQGARPRVSGYAAPRAPAAPAAPPAPPAPAAPAAPAAPPAPTAPTAPEAPARDSASEHDTAPRYDFRPSVPDVSGFPRGAWLRALRHAVTTASDASLGYGDPLGVMELRTALSDYLGRVRGVAAEPERVVITNGYTQSLGLVCHALAAAGARRIAHEDPNNPEDRYVARRAGLEPVPIGVDDLGIRVNELERAQVDAVVVTPAHQHPMGVVMTSERRAALVSWLRHRPAVAIEDDYDAEYRYDRAAIGALQGLDPDRVVYAGSASKTLAPALRLGWLVVPSALVGAIREQKLLSDRGTAGIEQLAFAEFLRRGELDRHLRRMRARYRARRDALIDALAEILPEATISGVAAGLHVTVCLTEADDDGAIREQAGLRRIAIETMSDFSAGTAAQTPTLMLGYAQMSEPAIRAGVHALGDAIRSARAVNPRNPTLDIPRSGHHRHDH